MKLFRTDIRSKDILYQTMSETEFLVPTTHSSWFDETSEGRTVCYGQRSDCQWLGIGIMKLSISWPYLHWILRIMKLGRSWPCHLVFLASHRLLPKLTAALYTSALRLSRQFTFAGWFFHL